MVIAYLLSSFLEARKDATLDSETYALFIAIKTINFTTPPFLIFPSLDT